MSNVKCPAGTWGYTADDGIYIPERKYAQLPKNHKAVALRGYAHVMAVMDSEDLCVGWILQENLARENHP